MIKDKKRNKRIRDRDPSQGGSHEEVYKQQETLSLACLRGSFGISEGNITGRGENHTHTHTHTHTEYVSNCNSHRRNSPDIHVRHQ